MKNPFYQNQLRRFDEALTKYPSTKALIEQLYLSGIIESYPRIKAIPNIESFLENEIRNEFVRDFKKSNSLLKGFIQNKTIALTAENQVYTSDLTQRTDIEFISASHSHKFVVEFKRLSSAEGRYLSGREIGEIYKADGLEKFIHLIYSEGDDEAAMISFVVKGKPEKIALKLKGRVKSFCPVSGIDELLKLRCVNWEVSFQSKHIRNDHTSILIYHLFLDFT